MQNNTPNDELNPEPIDPIQPLQPEPTHFGAAQAEAMLSEDDQTAPEAELEDAPALEPTETELAEEPTQPASSVETQTTIPTPPSPFFPTPSTSATPAGPIGSGPVGDVPAVELPPQKSKKKKLFILGGIIAGALIVLGGGSALAYNVWYQNPEKVVTDSLVKAVTAKAAQLTGSIDVKTDEYTAKVTFDAKAAEKNAELAVKVDYTAGEQTFKLDGAGHFSADGDLYVKVNNVKSIISALSGEDAGTASVYDDLAEKIEGKWIVITSEDIGDFSEEYKETQVCIEDVTKQVNDDKKLRNEVVDLYKKNNFIVIKESLGSRNINGVGSLGYVIDLDGEKTKTFAAGLAETEVGKKLKACDDSIDFKELADSIETEEAEATEGEAVVELWASRFGHDLTEVSLKGSDDTMEVTIVLNPVFNKDLTLETPTGAMSIEDLQAEFTKATESYYTEYYTELYS